MSKKSSTDYAELSGLIIALSNIQTPPKPNTQAIVDWMKARIKELEQK
jgi:hypothetical protein